MQEFGVGSVPITVVAKVYHKDAAWVRAGIVAGWLPIGRATRNGKLATGDEKGRTNFYISPKKLYEDTGYIWKGEHDVDRSEN